MKKLLYLLFSLFVLTACSNDDQVDNETIDFITVGKNALNGSENIQQSNLVINTNAEWNAFLNQLNTLNHVSETFNETTIDFTAYTVIAVIEEVKTSGADIAVINVTENPNTIQVTTELTLYSTAVISQPFHIIKIPKTTKQLIFN